MHLEASVEAGPRGGRVLKEVGRSEGVLRGALVAGLSTAFL